jgi:GT2 family glycosyltransferase
MNLYGALPPASLIICSWHRPQLLLDSVASVLQGEEVPAELIIMDQSDSPHPTLQTLGAVRGCAVRYVQTRRIGECPARNAGIELARHELLVFTDDDVFVSPTWFGNVVRALLEAGPGGVVTGRVLASEDQGADGFAPVVKTDLAPAIYAGRPGEDVLLPMNMAFWRAALQEVGDFDIRLGAGGPFKGAEDNDLGYRLLEAGYRIHYAPEAVVYHRAWRAREAYLPLRWTYGFCQGAFYAKHASLADRYILHRAATDVGRHAARCLRYLLRRSRRQTAADALYVLGILYGSSKWLLTQPRT